MKRSKANFDKTLRNAEILTDQQLKTAKLLIEKNFLKGIAYEHPNIQALIAGVVALNQAVLIIREKLEETSEKSESNQFLLDQPAYYRLTMFHAWRDLYMKENLHQDTEQYQRDLAAITQALGV